MPVTNSYYTDAAIRRAVYVERLKSGQRVDYDRVLAQVIPRIQSILLQYDVDNVADLSARQLSRLLNAITRELDKASSDFVKTLLAWMREFAHDQNDWNEEIMRRTLSEDSGIVVPYKYTDAVVFGGLVGSTGMTIRDSLRATIDTQRQHLQRRIKIAAAQNLSMRDAARGIIGTKGALYRDGLFGQLRNFGHEVIGSTIQFAANSTNLAFLNKYQDYVTGYMWVAVLDSKTSATCRSLDGQVFKYGEGPVPPAHPNCRSSITPVFSSTVEFARGLTRKASSGSIEAGMTYYQWLKTQSAAFQDSVLGKTRGLLFRRGGVSAEEFSRLNIGRNFEQLTLKELKRLRPEMFDAAGIT